MANEIVQDADAALTAELERSIIEEARPAMAAYQHCRITDISGAPTLADKFSVMPAGAVASSVTDGSAMSNTTINPTSVTITAGALGLGSLLTDLSAQGSLLNFAEVSGFFSRGVQEKLDTDVTATFANLTSNTTVGTSGAPMTLANFQVAQYELELAKAPGKYVFIGHTITVHQLRQAVAATAAAMWANPTIDAQGGLTLKVGKEAFKGTLLGVDVYSSPTCVTANAAADRVGAMIAAGQAIGFVWKWPLKVESIRAPLSIGTTITANAAYGTAVIKAGYGVQTNTSAT